MKPGEQNGHVGVVARGRDVHHARADRQDGRDLSDQADGPATVPLC